MRSRFRRNLALVSALALSIECVAAAAGVAQREPRARDIVILDSRVAARLLVDETKPEYPALAKVNYIQGAVRMQLRVTPEGRVAEAHVVHGHPFLAEAALQAVRRWVYRPLKRGAEATEFTTFVEVRFALHTRSIERLPPTPEKDLNRQIQPPVVLGDVSADAPDDTVRMRVLVGVKGQALDSEPLSGRPSDYDAARRNVDRWTFKPAHWGNHAVPWYLDVDVPVRSIPLADGLGDQRPDQ